MIEIKPCKRHQNFTIYERVIVEKSFTFHDGEPPQGDREWDGDPVRWCNPQPYVLIVTCMDCGFERFYGPHAKRPKWVQTAWDAIPEVEVRV